MGPARDAFPQVKVTGTSPSGSMGCTLRTPKMWGKEWKRELTYPGLKGSCEDDVPFR